MNAHVEPIEKTLREYGRGIAGGLLFSLPMLFTMELWWTGFLAESPRLIIYLLVGLLLLGGYNYFLGLRSDRSFSESVLESLEEMGLAWLITILVLWLIGQVKPGMSLDEILGKMVVESLTVAIGISIGKAQLGSNGEDEENGEDDHPINFGAQLSMAFCGAVIVAANVAPTDEVVVIALMSSNIKLLIIALISMAIGGAILYYSDFKGSHRSVAEPDSKTDVVAGVVIMYAVSLATSAFMLWFFGRFEHLSLHAIAAEMVVLGFPAALGASAGRLLLQS